MSELNSYKECRDYLDKGKNRKNTTDRPIANNTRVTQLDDSTIGIKYHNTYIVKYYNDGAIQLDTGGWLTVSTKERINRFNPIRVWSERHIWYTSPYDWYQIHKAKENGNELPVYHFQDRMWFNPDKTAWIKDENGIAKQLKPFSKAAEKRKRSRLIKIDQFIRKSLNKLQEGKIKPSLGDCFICQAFNGQPIGDVMYKGELKNGQLVTTPYKDAPYLDCIKSHVESNYFHFTFLMNAIKSECYDPNGNWGNPNQTYGLAEVDKHNISCWCNPNAREHKPFASDMTAKRLQRILKQFILKHVEL